MKVRGQSLIEVTIGIVVVVPVVLTLLDLSMIVLGVQSNDAACRNAARAAASGDPSQAQNRAQLAVQEANKHAGGYIVSMTHLVPPVDTRVTHRPVPQFDPLTSSQRSPGGAVNGTTTVTTEVDVKPFLVQVLYGGKTPLRFKATHTFPISYTEPADP